jgi:hypothetical protein
MALWSDLEEKADDSQSIMILFPALGAVYKLVYNVNF